MTTKLIGVREFRKNMSSLYKKARKNNLRYIVLKRNKPVFKIEPLSKKELILETLAKEIKDARKEVKEGKTYDFEKVCKEIGL